MDFTDEFSCCSICNGPVGTYSTEHVSFRFCKNEPFHPSYSIIGKKIVLKQVEPKRDTKEMFRIFNEPETMKVLNFLFGMTEEEHLARLEGQRVSQLGRRALQFLVCPKDCDGTDQAAGVTGILHMKEENSRLQGFHGIVLSHKVHGQGYGLEAHYLSLLYTFQLAGIQKVSMVTQNNAIRELYSKYGIRFVGSRMETEHSEVFEYEILEDEWLAIRKKMEQRLYFNNDVGNKT
mmetsp:Transcript_35306/g.56321  ORF Transcript_35306/g.56321 Transcript_35306/m.56321 type:complete len:234 (-) Transcript_35306:1748-2449(-)|eukprot:CAMPEP_0203766536 /NCGR_PEP_ID=MMETSP0099_2-20121227/477_1 /ASSEMBLY_ACC=CAM_ASM_000209 /TAXON_ID=96639 /ORGANISM=" , Strain NY0313808BC1" /LENGTH=233 /DNA_ID=CAMNT_0050662907 /DNA_START=17 /DNA_END=718 /DNA_ORIENTATION=-